MKNLNPITIFAYIFFISCKGSDPSVVSEKTLFDTSTAFIKEIPTYKEGAKKGDTRYLFTFIRDHVKEFTLDNLEHGFDSLSIRIWLGHSMAIKRHILIIKRKYDKWFGQLITVIEARYGENGEKIRSSAKNVKDVVPKSGWNRFMENILSFQITTLPDEEGLVGYNGCGGDGLPFYFEISTKQKYRFYSYCNIEDNIQNFAEARNVSNISRLVQTEFDFVFTQ